MSIKNNTQSLQSLLEAVNNLPNASTAPAENLDEEISTQETLISEQDAKIAELAEVLAGKASGGGSNGAIETCTVTIEYFNADFGGIGSNANSTIYVNTINNDGIIQYTILQSGEDFIFSLGMWESCSATIAIDNVVKNSILLIIDNSLQTASADGVDIIFDLDHYDVGSYFRAFNIIQNGSIKM